MNKSIFTQKIFAGIAALFCVLLLASCWENFSNEFIDFNDSTPPEVVLTSAHVTSSNIILNWDEPTPVTYSAVIINCTDGTTTTEQTVARGITGTNNVTISFNGSAERTITLTAIYSTGPRSKTSVFRVIPDGTALHFIYTPAQLDAVPNNSSDYWIVMNDLDLSGYSSGTGWTPITTFSGTFDGNGYTISNLTINKPDADYQGLFGTVANATIRNTHIAGCNITAKNYVGGLAGNIDCSNGSTCTISNCSVTGKVASATVETVIGFIGGFAGRITNAGSIAISHCSTAVDVKVTTTSTGSYNIGGFAGRYASNEQDSSIDYCMASGNVEVNTENPVADGKVIRVGGFIGMDASDYTETYHYGKITNCIASGRVYYNGPGGCNVGGFVGLSEIGAELSGCSSSGDVIIDDGDVIGTYAGGFTGFSHRDNKITGCSASGNVTGPRSIGGFAGLIGLSSGVIMENCHATGNVTGTFAEAMVGGFVGTCNMAPTIRMCYATGNVSGQYAGGFSGYTGNTHNTDTRTLTISNCYSTGHVSGTTYATGFSGYTICNNTNTATLTVNLTNCYSTGGISGTAANKNGFGYYTTSGANTTINVTGCFFNSTTAGSVTDSSAAGRSTSAMKTQSTYTVWDFTTVWAIGSINSGYPYLKDNPPVN